MSDLEEKKSSLEARNAELQDEVKVLMAEISILKHELIVHAKCGDANVDTWLSNEIKRFVMPAPASGSIPGDGTSPLPPIEAGAEQGHVSDRLTDNMFNHDQLSFGNR